MCTAVVNSDVMPPVRQATHWVCERHPASETIENPSSNAAGGERAVRGGNYDMQDVCPARLRWRKDRKLDQSTSAPTVGFRCAKDL